MIRAVLSCLLLFGMLEADRDGGPYIGLGYGVSKFNDDALFPNQETKANQSALFYAGAYINKHLSVELNYTSFNAFGINDGYRVEDQKYISGHALGVSTLAHYAFFDDRLDFYARFGVADLTLSEFGSGGFSFLVGAGTSWRVNDWFALRLAYEQYQFDYDADSNNVVDRHFSIDYIYTGMEFQF